ncbi:hypothetical protein CRE_00633 [Caenorhabditis remanei]|uniref:Uncharacterized protein n=1 Tax=Caenorhabditis remanei TaxID=31234 RepID=E3LDJ9_CAERE|nr:hypothetical protein CRE_00633 [Caenorhabditis remanei]
MESKSDETPLESATIDLNLFNLVPNNNKVEEQPDSTADKEAMSFTMFDVCQELDKLKKEITSKQVGKPIPTKGPGLKKYQLSDRTKHQKTNVKSSDSLSAHVSSLNPWSYYNRELKFIIFSKKMKSISDEEVIEKAREEIGIRIAYHKERCDENEDRMHVHFRHKLIELKSEIDRSKATVLLFVLHNRKQDEIEALERKMFPFPTKVLMEME